MSLSGGASRKSNESFTLGWMADGGVLRARNMGRNRPMLRLGRG